MAASRPNWAELKPGQFIRFSLALDAEGDVKGRARIVWSERSDLSYWSGAQFLKLSWGDQRRIRRVTNPSSVNWDGLADKTIVTLVVFLVTLLGWNVMMSPILRGLVVGGLIPTAFAAIAMGWALVVLLRR